MLFFSLFIRYGLDIDNGMIALIPQIVTENYSPFTKLFSNITNKYFYFETIHKAQIHLMKENWCFDPFSVWQYRTLICIIWPTFWRGESTYFSVFNTFILEFDVTKRKISSSQWTQNSLVLEASLLLSKACSGSPKYMPVL